MTDGIRKLDGWSPFDCHKFRDKFFVPKNELGKCPASRRIRPKRADGRSVIETYMFAVESMVKLKNERIFPPLTEIGTKTKRIRTKRQMAATFEKIEFFFCNTYLKKYVPFSKPKKGTVYVSIQMLPPPQS